MTEEQAKEIIFLLKWTCWALTMILIMLPPSILLAAIWMGRWSLIHGMK